MESLMSTDQLQIFAAGAVKNLSQTFGHYAAAAQEELPALTDALKAYASEAIHQSRTLMESEKYSRWAIAGTVVTTYLFLVQVLRFRNLRKMNKKYAPYIKDPSKLDYKVSHSIMKTVMLREAPWMYGFSTQMALVKTYAVAPGTELLVATRQLTQESTVGKRAEDTGVILTEFVVGDMDSERGLKALAKMNWLHRRYGNKIRRPEMIHTLAMFVLEPIRWFEKYEWRPMTPLEQNAIYTYWKEIGSRMGIADLPATVEDLHIWEEQYAKANMYFTSNNKACADATLGLFIRDLPSFMQGFVKKAAISLFDDQVRNALGYERSPMYISFLVTTIFKTRGFLLRHFFLPRFWELDPLPKLDKEKKLHRTMWAFEPWYIEDSVFERMKAWFWTGGKVVPGKKYKSEGILIEGLGPAAYETKSVDDVRREAEQLKLYADKGGAVGMGCPFKLNL